MDEEDSCLTSAAEEFCPAYELEIRGLDTDTDRQTNRQIDRHRQTQIDTDRHRHR